MTIVQDKRIYEIPNICNIISKGDDKTKRELIDIDKNKLKGEYLNGAYCELADLIGIDAVLKPFAVPTKDLRVIR